MAAACSKWIHSAAHVDCVKLSWIGIHSRCGWVDLHVGQNLIKTTDWVIWVSLWHLWLLWLLSSLSLSNTLLHSSLHVLHHWVWLLESAHLSLSVHHHLVLNALLQSCLHVHSHHVGLLAGHHWIHAHWLWHCTWLRHHLGWVHELVCSSRLLACCSLIAVA